MKTSKVDFLVVHPVVQSSVCECGTSSSNAMMPAPIAKNTADRSSLHTSCVLNISGSSEHRARYRNRPPAKGMRYIDPCTVDSLSDPTDKMTMAPTKDDKDTCDLIILHMSGRATYPQLSLAKERTNQNVLQN